MTMRISLAVVLPLARFQRFFRRSLGLINRSPSSSNTNRTTSGVSATDNNNNETAEASVVSEITERGSQNGRSFGRGAYNANN